MTDESIFGKDYSANGGLTSKGDLMLVSGLGNAKQAIKNRLLTNIKVYDYLSDYGCELYTVLGEKRNHSSLQLLDLIIRDSLNLEPRVQKVLELNCYFKENMIVAEINLELVDGSVLDLNIEY